MYVLFPPFTWAVFPTDFDSYRRPVLAEPVGTNTTTTTTTSPLCLRCRGWRTSWRRSLGYIGGPRV